MDEVTLEFSQTVPCALTHRRAVGEVFVTDSAKLDDDTFLAAIQLPRAHSLWGDKIFRFHDPLAIIEAARQVTFLTIHRYLNIPLGLPFILSRVEFRVTELGGLHDNRATPFEGIFRLSLKDRTVKEGLLTNLAFGGELQVQKQKTMELAGALQFVQRSDYKMLRAFARKKKGVEGKPIAPLPAPIDPARVGRFNPHNVAIGAAEAGSLRYPVICDQTHPSFFDHPQDHLPGPVILEAYRQTAIAAAQAAGALSSASAVVTFGEMDFTEFGEFELPTTCSAEVIDHSPRIKMALSQPGTQIATATYGLTAV